MLPDVSQWRPGPRDRSASSYTLLPRSSRSNVRGANLRGAWGCESSHNAVSRPHSATYLRRARPPETVPAILPPLVHLQNGSLFVVATRGISVWLSSGRGNHLCNSARNRVNQVGAQIARRNDGVQCSHLQRAMHAVDAIELARYLTQLFGMNEFEQFFKFDPEPTLVDTVALGQRLT